MCSTSLHVAHGKEEEEEEVEELASIPVKPAQRAERRAWLFHSATVLMRVYA